MDLTEEKLGNTLEYIGIRHLTEEKVGNSLDFIGIRHYFLNRIPLTQALRVTTNKWYLMKLKRFCKAKDTNKSYTTTAHRMGKDFHQLYIQ